MKRQILVLTAALVCAAPPVLAAVGNSDFKVKTTRDLVNLCGVSDSDALHDAAMGYCLGFIDAAHDYHQSITSGELLTPITCPAPEVTRQQAVDAFLAWAKSNQGLLDSESPINGLMRFASAEWPC